MPDRLCRSAEEQAFTEPESCKEAKQAWRLEADQAAQFFEEACLKEGDIGSSDLYQAYLGWAMDQGIRQKLTHKSFSSRVINLGVTWSRKNRGIMLHGVSLATTRSGSYWSGDFS